MISVLTIGSLYWSSASYQHRDGVQQCTSFRLTSAASVWLSEDFLYAVPWSRARLIAFVSARRSTMSTCDVKSWRDSERICQRCEALTCSGAALTLESFLSAFPSCKCKWIPSISKDSPFTCKCPSQGSHCRILLSVWPSVLAWDTFHHNSSPPLFSLNSTYIYDLGLLLLLPAGAASHVQERHLAPQPWEQKWSKQQVCVDWWKTFWIVLGFILKENLNPRVLYVLMIKHTKCQISWEVDSSCLFND